MIVDDDLLEHELLKTLLESEQYAVVTPENGKEALAEHKPDVILFDLIMPKLNGFQEAQQLKSGPQTRQIPDVVVTSLDTRDRAFGGAGNRRGRFSE